MESLPLNFLDLWKESRLGAKYNPKLTNLQCLQKQNLGLSTRVVKADFLKAVREAVAQRLIKAVKRLLYVVNKTNDCFKMHLTSVRLWASTFHY